MPRKTKGSLTYIILQKIEEVRLQQVRMRLDLVRSGRNLCSLQQLLGLFNREITDTDTPDLARFHELLQSCPGIGDRNIGYEESLRRRVGRGEGLVSMRERDGPVDLCIVNSTNPLLRIETSRTRYRSR
jgi:hypothetical protein